MPSYSYNYTFCLKTVDKAAIYTDLMRVGIIFLLVCLFSVVKVLTLTAQQTSIGMPTLGKVSKGQIVIIKDIDLHGGVCHLPKDITLVFKGGVIRNGTLIGNGTMLTTSRKDIFFHINIKGNWNVTDISTDMFADRNEVNALKNVLALTNPNIQNNVTINSGNYTVKALKGNDACLKVTSNTRLVINGSIKLLPNDYKHYNIILVNGKNIIIKGKGTIVGDKHKHTGTEGEWGMGIRFDNAKNSSVSGLTIKDCWGDCIYIGGDSKHIMVDNCILRNGRRQGISVTKADGVVIRKCRISDVCGTPPEYAIDIEPNRGCVVDHVVIDGVEVQNCEGGFMATRSMSRKQENRGTRIGSVTVRNSKITTNTKQPLRIKGCEHVEVIKSTVTCSTTKPAIIATNVENISIVGNTFIRYNNSQANNSNFDWLLFWKKDTDPVSIEKARMREIKDNKIIEK